MKGKTMIWAIIAGVAAFSLLYCMYRHEKYMMEEDGYLDPETQDFKRRVIKAQQKQRDLLNDEHA